MKLDTKDYVVVIIIMVLACGAGIVSAYQYIESAKKDKRDKEMSLKLNEAQDKALKSSEEIAAAQRQALQASIELKEAQNQTISKANELIEAQNKIQELQNETILQVVGSGHPRLKIMNSSGQNFSFFIKASQNYPVYGAHLRVTDAVKIINCKPKINKNSIEIDKSCYDLARVFSSDKPTDINGELFLPIDLSLLKRDYYLVSEFMTKSINTVQYSIIKFNKNELMHYFRIYEVSKKDHSFLKLLEKFDNGIPESEWQEHFFLAKTIIVDFAK